MIMYCLKGRRSQIQDLFKVSLFALVEENLATFVDVSAEIKIKPNNSNRKKI